MGRINLNSSSPVHLRFQFVSSGTESPVKLPKVLFTLFDLVGDGDHTDLELEVFGPSECIAPARMASLIRNAGKDPDGVPRYVIGDAANKTVKRSAPDRALQDPDRALEDPDLSPPESLKDGKSVREMWLDSVNRSAVFVFKGRSEFSVVARTRRGQDLEFAGWSEVADLGQKVSPEADGPGSFRLEDKFGDSSRLARRGSQEFDGLPLGSVSSLGIAAAAISIVVLSRLAKGALSRRAEYGILRAA